VEVDEHSSELLFILFVEATIRCNSRKALFNKFQLRKKLREMEIARNRQGFLDVA
jgi:hypothetical protein